MIPLLNKTSSAVCLRGFDECEMEQASKFLHARGHRVVRSLQAAQCIVAGPGAEPSLLEQSRARGMDVVAWDALREAAREEGAMSLLVPDGPEVPLCEEEILPLFRHEGDRQWLLEAPLPAAPAAMPENDRFVPQAARFAGLCFDQPFVETLQAVLTGATHAMPVALEGETAASKTTAVLYLAHRIGQPVVRLNLNGQTDAGELVGRHVPGDHGWKFQEGVLPQAMRRGHWLLLDEMNLAEPQVLERLNCALEDPPTLVLSEGAGTVFGPGGDVAVSERFRLLATLNPAEYSGRSVLSPAFRNRWLVWHHARAADEACILAMLRTLVLGEQPVVRWHGRAFRAEAAEPVFPQLGECPDADGVLARFAMFHSTVAKAAHTPGQTPGLARHSRERHTFTRRNLIATLRLCSQAIAGNPHQDFRPILHDAISQIYIDRFADAADRKAIQSHLRAADL